MQRKVMKEKGILDLETRNLVFCIFPTKADHHAEKMGAGRPFLLLTVTFNFYLSCFHFSSDGAFPGLKEMPSPLLPSSREFTGAFPSTCLCLQYILYYPESWWLGQKKTGLLREGPDRRAAVITEQVTGRRALPCVQQFECSKSFCLTSWNSYKVEM